MTASDSEREGLGSPENMEGGIAILLLLIIVVVGGGIAVALYLTGGALDARALTRKPARRRSARSTKRSRSPELEHTNFGSRSED